MEKKVRNPVKFSIAERADIEQAQINPPTIPTFLVLNFLKRGPFAKPKN